MDLVLYLINEVYQGCSTTSFSMSLSSSLSSSFYLGWLWWRIFIFRIHIYMKCWIFLLNSWVVSKLKKQNKIKNSKTNRKPKHQPGVNLKKNLVPYILDIQQQHYKRIQITSLKIYPKTFSPNSSPRPLFLTSCSVSIHSITPILLPLPLCNSVAKASSKQCKFCPNNYYPGGNKDMVYLTLLVILRIYFDRKAF